MKIKKEIIDWNEYESILKFRHEVEDGAGRFGKMLKEIKVSPVDIDDLYAEWIIPPQWSKDKVILYFHGGGYVTGTCYSHRSITAKFVKRTEIAAYIWLLDQGIEASNIVFTGDSAGGGLCLATLLDIKDKDMPLPAGTVAYSPITDFTCTGESHRTKLKVCLSPEGMTPALAKHYAGEEYGY